MIPFTVVNKFMLGCVCVRYSPEGRIKPNGTKYYATPGKSDSIFVYAAVPTQTSFTVNYYVWGQKSEWTRRTHQAVIVSSPTNVNFNVILYSLSHISENEIQSLHKLLFITT